MTAQDRRVCAPPPEQEWVPKLSCEVTRALAEALYKKAETAGVTVEILADLNLRVTTLRDAFRTP